MPALAKYDSWSTGHACYPPTQVQIGLAVKTFVNGLPAGMIGMQYQPHECGDTVHSGSARVVVGGSGKCFIEGVGAARIGDPISCGDIVGEGSPDTFIG